MMNTAITAAAATTMTRTIAPITSGERGVTSVGFGFNAMLMLVSCPTETVALSPVTAMNPFADALTV